MCCTKYNFDRISNAPNIRNTDINIKEQFLKLTGVNGQREFRAEKLEFRAERSLLYSARIQTKKPLI